MTDNKKETLLFFKSATKDTYKEKVLTALSLPINFHLYTWYDKKYVSETLWTQFIENPGEVAKKDAVIIFVDQKKDPFVFYPLRKCTFYCGNPSADKIDIWLKMGNYCKYNEQQLDEFNKKLQEAITTLPPNLNSYAQLIDCQSVLEYTETSASLTVLSDLIKLIADKAEENFKDTVFYWFSLKEAKKKISLRIKKTSLFYWFSLKKEEKVPKIKKINDAPYLIMDEEKIYQLRFDYYSKQQENSNANATPAKIVFNLDDSHFFPSKKEFPIPSDQRIYDGKLDFTCTEKGLAEIKIENEGSQKAPKPIMNVKINASHRNLISGALIFAGLLMVALPQIIELPQAFPYLKPILSLVIGPLLSAIAVYIKK